MNFHFKTFCFILPFILSSKTSNKFLHLYTDQHNNIGYNLSKTLNHTVYIYSTAPVWQVNTTNTYDCYNVTYTYFNSTLHYGYFDNLLQETPLSLIVSTINTQLINFKLSY